MAQGIDTRIWQTGQVQSETLLRSWWMALSQDFDDCWIGEPLWNLGTVSQQASQAGTGDGQSLCSLFYLINWSISLLIRQVCDHSERYDFDFQLIFELLNQLLGIVWSIDILPCDSRLTWTSMISSNDEVGTAMVLSDDCVPNCLSVTAHSHGQWISGAEGHDSCPVSVGELRSQLGRCSSQSGVVIVCWKQDQADLTSDVDITGGFVQILHSWVVCHTSENFLRFIFLVRAVDVQYCDDGQRLVVSQVSQHDSLPDRSFSTKKDVKGENPPFKINSKSHNCLAVNTNDFKVEASFNNSSLIEKSLSIKSFNSRSTDGKATAWAEANCTDEPVPTKSSNGSAEWKIFSCVVGSFILTETLNLSVLSAGDNKSSKIGSVKSDARYVGDRYEYCSASFAALFTNLSNRGNGIGCDKTKVLATFTGSGLLGFGGASSACALSSDFGSGAFCSASCAAAGRGSSADSILGNSNDAKSSPGSAMMAIGLPTGMSLAPSCSMILTTFPSSWASTSMVALSVSISNKESPDRNRSPSLKCHFTIPPWSMVGDIAGMLKMEAAFKAAVIWIPVAVARSVSKVRSSPRLKTAATHLFFAAITCTVLSWSCGLTSI